MVFIDQVILRQLKSPVVAAGAESFKAHLILVGSLHRFYPHHAKLNPALAVLQGEFVTDLQHVMNRAEASSIGSDVEGVGQFVDRIVGRVFPRYSHRQHYFDALVPTVPDAFSQVNPLCSR